MSEKIENIINFMRQHTLNIQLEENENAEKLTFEEEQKYYEAVKFSLDLLFGLREPKNEVEKKLFITPATTFELKKLMSVLSLNIPQEPKYFNNMEKVLNSYGLGSIDKKYLVRIGDPELNIYTTAGVIEKEIKMLKNVNHKFPNASVKVSINHVNEELNKREVKYNEYTKMNEEYGVYEKMSEEQRNAVYACCLTESMVSCIQGFAGAGKSFTMGAVSKIYKKLGYELQGVTLSAKAADVLESESKMKCTTVAQFISILKRRDGSPFDKPTVIIVDEAGLVGFEQMSELLDLITKSKVPVKLILSGDSTQLNPIREANSLELIEKVVPDSSKQTISQIRRQKSQSHINAVLNFKDGEAGAGLYTYIQQENVMIEDDRDKLVEKVFQDYFNSVLSDPDLTRLILCQDNNMVATFNNEIRKIMQLFGKVSKENFPLVGDKGKPINIAVGDKIIFTDNFRNLKLINKATGQPYKDGNAHVMNKLQGVITSITGDTEKGYNLKIDIPMLDDESDTGKVLTEVYCNTKTDLTSNKNAASLDLNYALTVYSSQGQTVDEVFVVDSSQFDCRNAYVALSRHRGDVKIYVNRQDVSKRISKKHKKNENSETNYNIKYISALDILNEVGACWSQNKVQNSAIVKALKTYEYLNEIAAKNRIQLDMNNLSATMLELKKNEDKEIISFNKNKGFVKEIDDKGMDKLHDSAEYYVRKPNKVDFNEFKNNPAILEMRRLAKQQNKQQAENNGNIETEFIPLINKKEYPLHPMIDNDFFEKYQNKLVAIGRGSEIRILGTTEEGVVFSKYDIHGHDGLGIGYPVMAHSGMESNNSDVYIIEDLNLYLDYLDKFYLNENNNTTINNDKPIIIWGNKTVDYSHILQSLENKNIKLIGNNFFKYNAFFRITHSIEGTELTANFDNIEHDVILNYLPNVDDNGNRTLPNLKMPVNRKKFGEYCNENALKNITYDSSEWLKVLSSTNDKFSWDNNAETLNVSKNSSTFVDKHGLLPMDFIKKYVVGNNLMTEKRFHEEIERRNERIENFLNKKLEFENKILNSIKNNNDTQIPNNSSQSINQETASRLNSNNQSNQRQDDSTNINTTNNAKNNNTNVINYGQTQNTNINHYDRMPNNSNNELEQKTKINSAGILNKIRNSYR